MKDNHSDRCQYGSGKDCNVGDQHSSVRPPVFTNILEPFLERVSGESSDCEPGSPGNIFSCDECVDVLR
jgi:hypothetical protein